MFSAIKLPGPLCWQFAGRRRGRHVSPSAKPWSGSQTLPSESVKEVVRPGLDANGGGATGAGMEATAGAAAASAAPAAAGAEVAAGMVVATVGVDAILLEDCSVLQPANKQRASTAAKQPGKPWIRFFVFCINFLWALDYVIRILVSPKNANTAQTTQTKIHEFFRA